MSRDVNARGQQERLPARAMDILPASELVPTDLPLEAARSPKSPGRDDPALSSAARDPHLHENPYAEAVRELPVSALLNPRALKHVSHPPDRPDEGAGGGTGGAPMGLVHEVKEPGSDLHK